MDNSNLYRLNHKVWDEALDINNLAQYGLHLLLSRKNLRVFVIDEPNNKSLLLEDYKFNNVTGYDDLVRDLTSLFDAHQLLSAGYWKDITLTIRNTPFSFIPSNIFEVSYLEQYRQLALGDLDENWKTFSFSHQRSSATNIFVIDSRVVDWVNSTYPNIDVKYSHQSSAFLEGILNEREVVGHEIFVCTETKYTNILVVKDGEMLYSNSFDYKTPQDFIYYLMFVMDELRLEPKTCPVTIYGEISADSTIYQLVLKYVKNVTLGTKSSHLSFGYVFDEVLSHRYFDLYSSYLLI